MLTKNKFRLALLPLLVLLNLTLIQIYRVECHQEVTAEGLVTYRGKMGWDIEQLLRDKLPIYKQMYPSDEVYPSVWITDSYYADPNHTLKYDVYTLTIYRRVYGPTTASTYWMHNPTIPYIAMVVLPLNCVIIVAAIDPEEMLKPQRYRRKPLFHGICGLYFSELLVKCHDQNQPHQTKLLQN